MHDIVLIALLAAATSKIFWPRGLMQLARPHLKTTLHKIGFDIIRTMKTKTEVYQCNGCGAKKTAPVDSRPWCHCNPQAPWRMTSVALEQHLSRTVVGPWIAAMNAHRAETLKAKA